MDANSRPNDFNCETYRLVTTRERRDEMNAQALEGELARHQPGIRIKAIHNTELGAKETTEAFGNLKVSITLCLGARVMITHNLCVSHGLVNGTVGIVRDIIVSGESQIPVAVLVTVRRKTRNQDGYSGPCFLNGELADEDPATEVTVALSRYQCEMYDRGTTHTRSQFPLMLAWAVTVHKAQGLTLRRATYNAGDSESHCGVTFVAMTRVRHPLHIAFSPMPDEQRLTSEIAEKPSLFTRKLHEHTLHTFKAVTADKYKHLSPPSSATAVAPRKPMKTMKTVKTVSVKATSKSCAQPASSNKPSGKRPALPVGSLAGWRRLGWRRWLWWWSGRWECATCWCPSRRPTWRWRCSPGLPRLR